MAETQTEKKNTNWIAIATAVLIPLGTAWYVDREQRLKDKDAQIDRMEKRELRLETKLDDSRNETKYWINQTIIANREIPQLLDTLKARIKKPRTNE